MSARRARAILIAAFAVSLLLHLLLAGYVRWPFHPPSQEVQVAKVRVITVARIVPTPPHTILPTPQSTPAASKPKVIPPAVTARGTAAPRIASASVPVAVKSPAHATASPAPTPIATAAPLPCTDRDITPAVSATAAPVAIPADARASKVNGTAAIQLHIGPQGQITAATIAQSSGSAALDAVAEQMAKGAAYTPALVKCKPVASVYTYTVKFVAW